MRGFFKVISKCAVILAACCASYQAQAATVAESVSLALSSHPSIDAGRASAKAAGETVTEQRSGYFPTISAGAGAGIENANNNFTRASTAAGDDIAWTKDVNVSLTQPLFAGFSTLNRVAAAKDRMESAKYDLGSTSEDVALRAARAHLNLMRTRDLLDLASAYYAEIQKRHDSIAAMVKEGASTDSEQLQAQEVLVSAKNTRLGYEEAWHQAEADYREVVGDVPLGKLEFGASTAWDNAVPKTVDDAVHAGVAASPKVLAAAKLVSATGNEADATRGDLSPHVDAQMNYTQKSQPDTFSGESKDMAGMIRMSWSFSTGGAEVARMYRSLDDRQEAQARRQMAVRGVEHDIRQKFTSMQIVDQQFDLLTERAEDVQKTLDSFLSQFEAGKQTNLQIITAQSRLFDAQAARTDASYRRLLSRFELLNAMGRLAAVFGAPPAPVKTSAAVKTAPAKTGL